MEQESIVYGCIKDAFYDDERRRQNRSAMISLPKAEDWPYLSQEMFSIPRMEVNDDSYLTDVIHFGASYKAIEYEWAQWMDRFESLLDKMYWVSAVVHLETELTGTHTFNWESHVNYHVPGSGVRNVRCEWVQENSFV